MEVALTAELDRDLRDLSGEYVLSTDTYESRLRALLHHARYHAGRNPSENRVSFPLYLPVGSGTTYHVGLALHGGDDLAESVITLSTRARPD